jgi:hypothetical protein
MAGFRPELQAVDALVSDRSRPIPSMRAAAVRVHAPAAG